VTDGDHSPTAPIGPPRPAAGRQGPFHSDVIERLGASRVWRLPGGEILLPRVFGFCRGVTRAMEMLESALAEPSREGRRFYLLGQIIHNPWVNRHFESLGVTILGPGQMERLSDLLRGDDCGVIPAFGVPVAIEQQLRRIGCRIIDTTCPDVRRLWAWARQAVERGYGVLIYGRADHDETIVTKSHLQAAGGQYLVVGSLEEARRFCDQLATGAEGDSPQRVFGSLASNAPSWGPLLRLAQVSQTTMLYEETLQVRDMLRDAFQRRFGAEGAGRLLFQPTVCRATQDRQSAARELCEAGCDLFVVVGGFGSSNTRHLYELARRRAPARFIEDASAIGADVIRSYDADAGCVREFRDWLPARRPLRIALLAGASSPEAVVGEVLHRLADLLR
jgi:4-hydroxy-3-methylbut-2-en-1-yl diphosphate reductase